MRCDLGGSGQRSASFGSLTTHIAGTIVNAVLHLLAIINDSCHFESSVVHRNLSCRDCGLSHMQLLFSHHMHAVSIRSSVRLPDPAGAVRLPTDGKLPSPRATKLHLRRNTTASLQTPNPDRPVPIHVRPPLQTVDLTHPSRTGHGPSRITACSTRVRCCRPSGAGGRASVRA